MLQPLLLNVIGIPAAIYIVRSLGPTSYGQWAAAGSLVATIAHELHHATELLSDTDVTDAAGVLRFYRRLAMGDCAQGASDVCETEGALAAEARVLDKLRRPSRH